MKDKKNNDFGSLDKSHQIFILNYINNRLNFDFYNQPKDFDFPLSEYHFKLISKILSSLINGENPRVSLNMEKIEKGIKDYMFSSSISFAWLTIKDNMSEKKAIKQIANELKLSEDTVRKNHLKNYKNGRRMKGKHMDYNLWKIAGIRYTQEAGRDFDHKYKPDKKIKSKQDKADFEFYHHINIHAFIAKEYPKPYRQKLLNI